MSVGSERLSLVGALFFNVEIIPQFFQYNTKRNTPREINFYLGERQRQRQTERETETDRERERDRERQRETERDRERDREI